jgi:tRNA-dihydrouridine synthase A
MREADLVADICAAMNDGGASSSTSSSSSSSSSSLVSVKCRIGVDNDDSYEQLHEFVRVVGERGGVQHFIVHARKAILKGLSPDQNRKIPPLKVSQSTTFRY